MKKAKPEKVQLTEFAIQTGVGFYDYETPSISTTAIHDIAWALAGIRRWNGFTKPYISVAQHVCFVRDYMKRQGFPLEAQFRGLHHDDHEALRGDIPSPRKRFLRKHKMLFEGEEAAEDKYIYETLLGISAHGSEAIEAMVKHADYVSLVTEKTYLKPDTVKWVWVPDVAPEKEHVFEPYLSTELDWSEEYLHRHYDLVKDMKHET